MARPCSICNHPERANIEAAVASGTSLRNVSKQFSVGFVSVQRHTINHLVEAIKEVKREKAKIEQDDIQAGFAALDRMARGETIVDEMLKTYWGEKTEERVPDTTLKVLAEMRKQIELRAKLQGELDPRDGSAEWANIRLSIIQALASYPDARIAVAGALTALEVANARVG